MDRRSRIGGLGLDRVGDHGQGRRRRRASRRRDRQRPLLLVHVVRQAGRQRRQRRREPGQLGLRHRLAVQARQPLALALVIPQEPGGVLRARRRPVLLEDHRQRPLLELKMDFHRPADAADGIRQPGRGPLLPPQGSLRHAPRLVEQHADFLVLEDQAAALQRPRRDAAPTMLESCPCCLTSTPCPAGSGSRRAVSSNTSDRRPNPAILLVIRRPQPSGPFRVTESAPSQTTSVLPFRRKDPVRRVG